VHGCSTVEIRPGSKDVQTKAVLQEQQCLQIALLDRTGKLRDLLLARTHALGVFFLRLHVLNLFQLVVDPREAAMSGRLLVMQEGGVMHLLSLRSSRRSSLGLTLALARPICTSSSWGSFPSLETAISKATRNTVSNK